MGRLRRVAALVLLGATLVMAAGACTDEGDGGGAASSPSGSSASSASRATATSTLPPVDGPFAPGRTPLPGFGEVEVRIVPGPDGEPIVVCVLLAETPQQRQRGLMGVDDVELGGYAGMLFVYDADVTGGFWMRDTLLPLSIAYLDVEGALVSTRDMEPCAPDAPTCPTYPPEAPYRSALEVPQGQLEEIGITGPGARLERLGECRAA